MIFYVKSFLIGSLIVSQLLHDNLKADSNWPSWRGSTGNGTAPDASNPPTEWSEEKNILWKTKLEGLGHSTPVIWEDKIFLTSAVPFGKKTIPPVQENGLRKKIFCGN